MAPLTSVYTAVLYINICYCKIVRLLVWWVGVIPTAGCGYFRYLLLLGLQRLTLLYR